MSPLHCHCSAKVQYLTPYVLYVSRICRKTILLRIKPDNDSTNKCVHAPYTGNPSDTGVVPRYNTRMTEPLNDREHQDISKLSKVVHMVPESQDYSLLLANEQG